MSIRRRCRSDRVMADGFYVRLFFFFNDTATTEIYTLSLHDALPISRTAPVNHSAGPLPEGCEPPRLMSMRDRKSTRLNSSHGYISYAVFCLKKKIESLVAARRLADDLVALFLEDLFDVEPDDRFVFR